MKRMTCILILALSLLLTGCSSFQQGEYEWVEPHRFPLSPGNSQEISAADYSQLYNLLTSAVRRAVKELTVSVVDYDRERLQQDLQRINTDLLQTDPVAAYAVQEVTCTLGTSGSNPALAVQIEYSLDRIELSRIKWVADHEEAMQRIGQALNGCESTVVLLIENYTPADFEHLVADYGNQWPEHVMEQPQVAVNIYPEEGKSRLVELKFTYQTSRESLKKMQSEVQPIFAASQLYVQGDGTSLEKHTHLYSFLMERYSYQIETSITPAYSLLRHGVGDSRAFANVYAAMCNRAGLKCMVVSGTKNGQSHYWNIILDMGVYYHVDLLRCRQGGEFILMIDADMAGYVWDYSAYPPCGPREEATPPNNEEAFGPNTAYPPQDGTVPHRNKL